MKQLCNKYFHLSRIPKDLDSVTTINTKNEVDPQSVGMTQADVDAIWGKVVSLYKSGTHPAITVSIYRQGKQLISRGIGHAHGNGPEDDPDTKKILATADTPICLFSTSKGITALLIHMLAEDGLINIMDPVSFYAPEFARKGKENITIHHILSHRGGIPGLPTDMPLEDMWDNDKTWELMCDAEPITTDGSELAYHAVTGGFVLEKLVRNVTGEDMNALIDKKIRKPMGMKYFTYGLEKKLQKDMAEHYATGPSPGFILTSLMKSVIGVDISTLSDVLQDSALHDVIVPSANLVASANEVASFFQMMLDGGVWQGKRICSSNTIARAVQEYGSRTIDKTLMMPMRYSAGMMLGDEPFGIWGPHSKHAFGHAGLVNKLNWADPEREIAVSILNTGIPLLSHHVIPLVGLIRGIANQVPRSGIVEPYSLLESLA